MDEFMRAALDEARKGLQSGGIPIGSVVVRGDRIVGRGHNQRVQKQSAILHAEMDALEQLGRQPASFYKDVVLYTTLSPCAMCSGAILLYGIRHVVIGEDRNFQGEADLLRSRGVELKILNDETCYNLLRDFISARSELWNEDIGE